MSTIPREPSSRPPTSWRSPTRPDRRRSTEWACVAGALLIALLIALVYPSFPGYDGTYHLVWASELLDGRAPTFEADAASTQHPAYLALCLLLQAGLADAAPQGLVAVTLMAFVLLNWGVFRLGRACFGRRAAAVAVLITASSLTLLLLSFLAFVDVMALALIVNAGALEVERPHRRRSVMGLLAVAGLLRPEAWLLAGLYWLGRGTRRWDLLALAALAPAVWMLVDLAVTGDPLFSLHATSAVADDFGRERGITNVPGPLMTQLADAARPPIFLAGLVGLALAWRARSQTHALAVPVAMVGAGVVTFIATGAAGLSIIPRYLLLPAVALGLFAAYALSRLERRLFAATLVLGAAYLVLKIPSFVLLDDTVRLTARMDRDIEAVLRDPALARCSPLTVPTYRLVPNFRLRSGRALAVASRVPLDRPDGPVRPRAGVALYVEGDALARDYYGKALGIPAATNVRPPRAVILARHGVLVLVDECGVRSRPDIVASTG